MSVHNGRLIRSGANPTVVAAATGGWLNVAGDAGSRARSDITGGSLTRYDFGISSNTSAVGAIYQSADTLIVSRPTSPILHQHHR